MSGTFMCDANPSSWKFDTFTFQNETVGKHSRPSRTRCCHVEDLLYCSNAFGSAVIQTEMLKLVTEKKEPREAREHRTLISVCPTFHTLVLNTGWLTELEVISKFQFNPGNDTSATKNKEGKKLHNTSLQILMLTVALFLKIVGLLCASWSCSAGRNVVFAGETSLWMTPERHKQHDFQRTPERSRMGLFFLPFSGFDLLRPDTG